MIVEHLFSPDPGAALILLVSDDVGQFTARVLDGQAETDADRVTLRLGETGVRQLLTILNDIAEERIW